MKCGVWTVQCEVWGVKSAVWSVECEVCSVKKAVRSDKCEVWTVKCEVRSVECEVWSVKCGVWSVKSAVRSVKCEGRSGASNVTCERARHFHRVHARTGLAGARERSYRRKFRSQTSDNMERWKAEQGRGREKRKIRRKKSRRERVRRQKMQMREEVGKSRNTVFFQWFVAPEGRKVGSLKRRVRSQLARGEMKNCTPLWREAHFEVKMYKTHQVRTTFGSWDVEKVHAVVARSTCPSQNVQNTPLSDHFWKLRCRKVHAVVARSIFRSQNVQNTRGSDRFWKLRCRKSARRCGAKHISKSKCTKHHMFAPLLEVRMLKKCTPLWREAHFEVKMYKTCRFAASLHYTTLRYITPHSTILHYITLHYTPRHYNYNYTTRLHSTTLHPLH